VSWLAGADLLLISWRSTGVGAVDADRASHTAVLVCQGRAAPDGRIAEGRFADPTAMALLRDDERVAVQRVRAGAAPRGWGARVEFEMVRASADVIVARTVAIDDAIRARPAPQLVIVGAGLDDRAWRMPELADVEVFEVDHPASQQDKRSRVGDLQPLAKSVRFVPVDFTRDRLDSALAAAGHQRSVPTSWLWEGVVPYLSKADVAATVAGLAARSGSGSRLVVNYQTRALTAVIGRLTARAMTALARQPSPWRSEPRRSSWTPNAMHHLLASHGYTVARDHDLLTTAEQLHIPVRQRRSLRNGRIATANPSSPSEPDRR
jgi:methyltransferase (TIGR00027 family)